jgi:hypothetical protein
MGGLDIVSVVFADLFERSHRVVEHQLHFVQSHLNSKIADKVLNLTCISKHIVLYSNLLKLQTTRIHTDSSQANLAGDPRVSCGNASFCPPLSARCGKADYPYARSDRPVGSACACFYESTNTKPMKWSWVNPSFGSRLLSDINLHSRIDRDHQVRGGNYVSHHQWHFPSPQSIHGDSWYL